MVYDYEYFKKEVYALTKIDLSCYKQNQMKRRIDALIAKHKIKGYDNFVKAIRTDHKMFEAFVNYLTINVSEFYRNPEQWKTLDKEVFPGLIKRFGTNLKIWSAACSTGDEPYSLVMALAEHIPIKQIKIIATDIDKQVIETAKLGLYGAKSIAAVPEPMKKKYFTKVGTSYRISDEVKSRVEFKESNLLKDPYPTNCHMIVCRNVLIYFTEEAKDEVFVKFRKSLVKDGVLFIGSTEQILNYKDIGYGRMSSFFYQAE
ncbi:MAG: protein-glutamate O-methyltransferase CheR [Lachnospiraceae bacterium]|nr:protein-glutamate O-methyltransferase CheR [Lachnospiraceae bacterium]